MQLGPGILVAKKYRLDRQIGAGGMGEVWAAYQQPTNKLVALKFLKAKSEGDAGATKRFLREARAVCAVRHPNVVEVHDVLELEDGWPVMVMEFLDGESLEQRLARDRRIPFGDFAAILARTVSAVGAAHEAGIVHRDLKPDNIFLSKTSIGTEVKVLDFGIAKVTAIDGETAGLTNTGAMLGTPYYMAPEQAFGEKRIDHRADIWSLGIILYRGVTGILPTQADNLGQILKMLMTSAIRPVEELAPSIPEDLKVLINRMLSTNPDGRPADLREVRAVLDRYAGVETTDFGAPREAMVDSTSMSGTQAPTSLSKSLSSQRGSTQSGGTRWLAGGVGLLVVVAGVLGVGRLARKTSPEAAQTTGVAVQGTLPATGTVDLRASGASVSPSASQMALSPSPSLSVSAVAASASAAAVAAPRGKLPKPAVSVATAAPVVTASPTTDDIHGVLTKLPP